MGFYCAGYSCVHYGSVALSQDLDVISMGAMC